MTLATERNVTDNWKRNGSEHGLQIMAGDGEVDTRRGRKVYGGDVISYNGQDVKVLSGNE